MSWFTSVTGTAEHFLNKLDKSAAGVLHTENEVPVSHPTVVEPFTPQYSDESKSLSPSQSVPSNLYSLKDPEKKSLPSSSGSVKGTSKSRENTSSTSTPVSSGTKAKKDSDAALFDFLNSKDSNEIAKKKRTPLSSRHHSRQSSTSSIVSSTSKGPKIESSVAVPLEAVSNVPQDLGGAIGGASGAVVGGQDDVTALPDDSPTNSHMSADMDVLADAMKESSAGSDQSAPEENEPSDGMVAMKDRKLSSLELENRLLRNEVASLNQEMITALKRAKDSETESSRMRDKLNAQVNSATMQDQLARELQSREMDLTEALNAKDSQLAVLRVRLEEADKRVSHKEKSLEEVKLERERILKDHTDSSGMHGEALDAMRLKMEELESSLKREQDAYKQVQREAEERQNRLQQEQQTLMEGIKSAERMHSEEKAKAADLLNQLKAAKSSSELAKKELSDYKDKAARILQSKERLISSLREGGGALTASGGVSMLEHEALRQEKDMLKEELQQTKLTAENLRQELQDMETQFQQESDTSQEMIKSLEDTAKEEKRRREDAEQEILRLKQELQYTLDELHKQKSAFQSRMQDREADIEKLRNQLMTKSMSSSSETELESRVRSLTESLIQKQTILEALSTEKNSLGLQLERLQQQHRDLEDAIPRQPISQFVATSDHEDDVRQRLPLFLREVPTDHEVTRRVKRAASSIDKVSIRLGVFLRRYPIARVFVVLYMALLHVWVLIVMMTYQPEIHGSDFQPKPPEA